MAGVVLDMDAAERLKSNSRTDANFVPKLPTYAINEQKLGYGFVIIMDLDVRDLRD